MQNIHKSETRSRLIPKMFPVVHHEHAVMWAEMTTEETEIGGVGGSSICIQLQLCSAALFNWPAENLSSVRPWHRPRAGASPASPTVPWETLGRISVSVAAYKGLMDAHALEWRSSELSTGSLILTHSTHYCTHSYRHHTVWWMGTC